MTILESHQGFKLLSLLITSTDFHLERKRFSFYIIEFNYFHLNFFHQKIFVNSYTNLKVFLFMLHVNLLSNKTTRPEANESNGKLKKRFKCAQICMLEILLEPSGHYYDYMI